MNYDYNTAENILALLDQSKYISKNAFVQYLDSNNHHYAQAICQGKENIPTPGMINKFIKHNAELVNNHPLIAEKLNKLQVISHNFYLSIIKLVHQIWDHHDKFDEEFKIHVQPYGQEFINTLKLIYYKIDEVKLDNPGFKLKKYNNHLNFDALSRNNNVIFKTFAKAWLIAKQFLANFPQIFKRFYIFSTVSLITLTGVCSFFLAGSIINIEKASYIAAYASLTVLICSIAFYTVHIFEHFDVNGRNILAYNYKTLLNSTIYSFNFTKNFNNKKYNLFS